MATDMLSARLFLARLHLERRLGESVTLSSLGEAVAKRVRRDAPFSPAAVSRWFDGSTEPTLDVIEAVAAVCKVDPGWLAFGRRSAAPAPDAGS